MRVCLSSLLARREVFSRVGARYQKRHGKHVNMLFDRFSLIVRAQWSEHVVRCFWFFERAHENAIGEASKATSSDDLRSPQGH